MLLEFLFPKTCLVCGKWGEYYCSDCAPRLNSARSICPACEKGSIGGLVHERCRRPLGMDGLVSLFAYRGGMQRGVKKLKYRFVRELGVSLVDLVEMRMDQAIKKHFQEERYMAVPVPLHPRRERWRGFNQAALLAELLASRWGLKYKDLLLRSKNTEALAELRARIKGDEKKEIDSKYASQTQRREEYKKLLKEKKTSLRKEQMLGAFKLRDLKLEIKGKKFLIVDDVWTSGATMLECTKALKRRGAEKVWGFALARSGW